MRGLRREWVKLNNFFLQFLAKRPEIRIMRTMDIMRQLMTQYIPNS